MYAYIHIYILAVLPFASDLLGYYSHGLTLLPVYSKFIL